MPRRKVSRRRAQGGGEGRRRLPPSPSRPPGRASLRTSRLLEEEIRRLRRVVETVPPSLPEWPVSVCTLAVALYEKFAQTNAPEDLQAALDAGRRAAGTSPRLGVIHALGLSSLARSLHDAYMKGYATSAGMNDLHEAIRIQRMAIANTPCQHPAHEMQLSDLANMLLSVYKVTGDKTKLDVAIDAFSRVWLSSQHTFFSAGAGLGGALLKRFRLAGSNDDIHRSVAVLREVVGEMIKRSDASSGASSAQTNLAAALRARFELLGEDETDITEAIALYQTALTTRRDSDPFRSTILSNLGNALRSRFEFNRSPADLDLAIEACRDAIGSTSPTAPALQDRLVNLAMALTTRFDSSGSLEDLLEVIELLRHVIDSLSDERKGARVHFGALLNLANALTTQCERSANSECLCEAITSYREALSLLVPGDPDSTRVLIGLGRALRLAAKTGNPELADEAIGCFRDAVAVGSSPTLMRLVAASECASLAWELGRIPPIVDTLTLAVSLFPRLAWRGLQRRSRERQISRCSDLAREVGASFLEVGESGKAVEILEEGRSVLWRQFVIPQGQFESLESVSSDLADRLAHIRVQLP